MMSSVPYVPPDTMKNVAATSGQSVSLAVRLVWGIARVGNWAGEGYSAQFIVASSISAILALFLACLARVRIVQNTDILRRCKTFLYSESNYFLK